jgi:hypothetical protein
MWAHAPLLKLINNQLQSLLLLLPGLAVCRAQALAADFGS